MDANKRLKDSHNANKFSSYKILSKLGHGAYGTVYKAQHITTMEVLAIKAVQVEEDEFIEDYMTEINLVQNLSNKNIVKCYGFEKRVSREESNNNAFRRRMKSQRCELLIFLEYCANGSLKDMMCDETIFPGKFIPENLAKGYIKQTLEGLKYLHEQGVIHRDIKCANLLVSSPENTIKLADFGISTQITNTLKSGVRNGNEGVAMTCIGSPNWMAPEILLGQGATSKSDIWSLGSTLVEMLTGKPPFYNLSNREAVCYAIVHDYFIFTKKDRERLSSSSLLFVDYLFNKNIFERPSAKDLLEKKFIDSTKNSSWLFEEEDDVQFKNDKLKKFRETDNDNQLTMFDDDFIAVENMNGNPKDKYDTGMSMAIQDSPFKPKPKTHKEINSHSLREAFVSLARTDFIIEKMETEKLNSFEFLKIIEELNNDDLTRLILNKLIIFKKGQVLDYNLMTLFKILFGKIDKLGLEMTSKINALLESFLKLNGSDCLVLYWSQILDDPTLDNLKALKMWIYLCFLNNGLDRLSFSPLIINFLQKVVMGFEEFDMIIWKLVLKISFYVINKYGDYYISIFNPLIDYLVKIESFDSENDFEMFKIFFLKITEINARMTTSQIKKLVTTKVTQNEKMWNYFLVKVMNNILRNSNEKKTTIDLENDLKVKSIENKSIFILNKFFKKWMFEDICDQLLLLNFDDILDFKFCRYVFELIYNMFTFQSSTKLMFIDKTFLLITCEKLSLLKLDPKIFDSNTLKYHRYDLKLIIKLIADLSIEFDNKSLDLSLRVYEYYAYVSLLYLQRHITYSTYAIDTLSNCCHVLLDAKIMTFPNVKTMQLSVDGKNILNTDLRLFLNGFIEMNLIKNFTSEDKKNEDYKTNSFDLVFKSIHKLLSSMTISVNTKIEENVDVTRDDVELEFSQQYSPLSLFIVDHPNFFDIVQTILDKYQGSLILQIDFLKFLKLVFKQYVGFKINYYMNKENMIQKDDMNKKMNSYNNLKQDANIGDMFPKRTQNFKLVRDYLLGLWEQSPKKANIDNMSAISSVHSSPKKLLSNQEKGFIFTHVNENTKTQGRVGHNSIIIKTLLRDIDLIYKQSITLA